MAPTVRRERVMEPKSVQITRRLWWGLGALLVVSFGIMLWIGKDIYQTAPPMPEQVVTRSGQAVYTRDDIAVGRSVWQSIGGQQNGSIWGHGALIAPAWSAEWPHSTEEGRSGTGCGRSYGTGWSPVS